MQLKKQDVNIGKAVFEGEIRADAEGSIIVPDIKPDILKILQVDAEAYLCEKYISDSKVTLKGKVKVNVLYLPEGDEYCVQCIKGCFEFCETVKRAEFTPDMKIIACCDAQKAGYKLINSRKVGINVQALIDLQVVGGESCLFVSDIEEDSAQTLCGKVSICSLSDYREFDFALCETLEFPTSKCAALEILKTNIMIFDKEYKTLPGKLVVKGRVNASMLYLDEERRCDHAEFEIPFTEVFDMEELTDDCICDISYEIGETDFKLTSNTASRSAVLSADIRVCVKTEMQKSMTALCDCYFTDADCNIAYSEIETSNILERPSFSAVMKELLQKGAALPDIESVYSVAAKPYITAAQPQGGRIAVSGKLVVYVLYTTANQQMPVASINEEIPFNYMIDCESAGNDCEVVLSCECEHISYTLSSPGAVEVRCGIVINGKTVKKSSVKVISDVEPLAPIKEDSGIVVYFVKNGDSVWDIAKKYHVKSESILAYNNIEKENSLKAGDKIIIPIV